MAKEQQLSTQVEDDLSLDFKQAVLAECARKLSSVRERLQSRINECETQLNEAQEIIKFAETQAEERTVELEKTKKEAQDRQLDYEKKLAAANEQVIVRTEYADQLTQKTDKQIAELREELKKMQEARHQAELRAATAEARPNKSEK